MEHLLPDVLMLDVLSRLPVNTIINCKLVCKKWRDLVSEPYFVHLHLSRPPEALVIHECSALDFFNHYPGTLEWVEMEHEPDHYHLNPIKTIDLKSCYRDPLNRYFQVICQVGSVNGLICYCHPYFSVYIFNPVLEQYIILPQSPLELMTLLLHGFGVSMKGEYKVVRICGRAITSKAYAIEIAVYTLGTGQWRVLGPNLFQLKLKHGYWGDTVFLSSLGVFLNSHVYWLNDPQIYGFDLNTETFKLVSSPPVDKQESRQMLGVLKGRLSLIRWGSLGLEVWVMKDDDSWNKEIAIQENINSCVGIIGHIVPLWVMDDSKGNSIMLLCDQRRKGLVAYCLNTKKVIRIPILHRYIFSIRNYRPSFVKLEEFGLEEVHAVNVQRRLKKRKECS